MKKKLLIGLLAITCAFAVTAEEKPVEKKTLNPVKNFNNLKIGKISGRIRTISMQRDENRADGNGGNSHSNAISLKINYQSPELFESGLKLNAQFVDVEVMESGGGNKDAGKAAGSKQSGLSNGQGHALNELNLDWNLKLLGLEKSNLKVGRQVITNDFMLSYEARHKPQSFEGAVLNLNDLENLKFQLGYVQRFSSWSPLETDAYTYHFTDISDVILAGFPVKPASVGNRGIQFISANYTGIHGVDLTIYDYYAPQLINTYGIDSYFTLCDNCTLNLKYAQQKSLGELKNELSKSGRKFRASLFETQLKMTLGDFVVTPTFIHIPGDNKGHSLNNFMTPFSFDSASVALLLEYDAPRLANSNTYMLSTAWKATKSTSVWAIYSYTDHDITTALYDGQEVNLVVTQKLTNDLTMAIKLGYAERNGKRGVKDSHKNDIRLFLSYNF